MKNKVFIGLGGAFSLFAGVVLGSSLDSNNNQKEAKVHPNRFSILAKTYDKQIGGSEKSIGLEKIRKNFIAHAQGKVLETCAGTGRNNEFYDYKKLSELTLFEASEEMLNECRNNNSKNIPEDLKVNLIQGTDLKIFPKDHFDTVVDTFGICSVEDPEAFLKDINRILKPGGTVLLLEHGRVETSGILSSIINYWLDFRAAAHANYWGCLWNREIQKYIQSAGFITKSKVEHHLGTCVEYQGTKP